MYEKPKINSAGNGSTFLKTQCTKISGHSIEEIAFFYARGKQKQRSPLTEVRSVKNSQLFIELPSSYKQLKTFLTQKMKFFLLKYSFCRPLCHFSDSVAGGCRITH
jgi:hypothetical protein